MLFTADELNPTVKRTTYDESWVVMVYATDQVMNLGNGTEWASYTVEASMKKDKEIKVPVKYDSEAMCFFAYTETKEDGEVIAQKYIEHANRLISGSPAS